MQMSRLINISIFLFSVFFGFGRFGAGAITICFSAVHGLISFVFFHDFLDSSLHHSEVLLGVDMFGLGFVLHVVNLSNVALLFLIAFEAVVDTGGRAWWLIE